MVNPLSSTFRKSLTEDQHDLSDTRFEPTRLKVRRLTTLISIVTHRAQVHGPQQEKVTAHSAE